MKISKKRKRKKKKIIVSQIFIIALSIFLFLLLSYFSYKSSKTNIIPFHRSSTIPVIDIAKWEGEIDWQKVRNSGIQHAI